MGAWWTMAEKRLCGGGTACSRTLWSSTRYPSWWQDVRNTWRRLNRPKNCWCFGYTLYPHIMFERGLTKPHRIFRMTHIDDANVIPCCCLWQNWFSCVLASMPSPLMFELRILLKGPWSLHLKTRWKVTSAADPSRPDLKLQIQDPKSKRAHLGLPNQDWRLNQSKIRNPKPNIRNQKSKITNPKP